MTWLHSVPTEEFHTWAKSTAKDFRNQGQANVAAEAERISEFDPTTRPLPTYGTSSTPQRGSSLKLNQILKQK